MNKTTSIKSLTDLQTFAQDIYNTGAQVFLLEGNLGVGKTQFVKEFVEILGGNKNETQSPTYSYINTYTTLSGEALHIDMYRLENEKDAFKKGIFDAIDNYNYIFIERPKWEDQYADHKWMKLRFEFGEKEERIITIVDVLQKAKIVSKL